MLCVYVTYYTIQNTYHLNLDIWTVISEHHMRWNSWQHTGHGLVVSRHLYSGVASSLPPSSSTDGPSFTSLLTWGKRVLLSRTLSFNCEVRNGIQMLAKITFRPDVSPCLFDSCWELPHTFVGQKGREERSPWGTQQRELGGWNNVIRLRKRLATPHKHRPQFQHSG